MGSGGLWLLVGFQITTSYNFLSAQLDTGDPVLSHTRFLPRPQLVVCLMRQFSDSDTYVAAEVNLRINLAF